MPGTRIENCRVTKVTDGDTIRVQLPAGLEDAVAAAELKMNLPIRVGGLDTEESQVGGNKPVTAAGFLASDFAKATIPLGSLVTLEFDTSDPVERALIMHQDNFGRLLAYVLLPDGREFGLEMIRLGFSPYFVKYGRSRLYHAEYLTAELRAQAGRLVIWDPTTNAGGPTRDYGPLLPWWTARDGIVEDYRRAAAPNVLSVRLDHAELVRRAGAGEDGIVFVDIQEPPRRVNSGFVVMAGSPNQPFDLFIADAEDETSRQLSELITRRYAGQGGRGYVYVQGPLRLFRDRPQLDLAGVDQLGDVPFGA